MVFQRRDALVAVGEDVGDHAHRLPRRIDVGAAGDVFLQQVVLDGAATDVGRRDALLFGDQLVEQQQDRCRRVDGHRRRDLLEGEAGEEQPHVLERVDRPRRPCRLRPRRAGDRSRSPSASEGRRRTTVPSAPRSAGSGIARWLPPARAEARVLAHRPEATAVHRRVDAPRVGRLAGLSEPRLGIPAGEILRRVRRPDLDARISVAFVFGHAVKVTAGRLRRPSRLSEPGGACRARRTRR